MSRIGDAIERATNTFAQEAKDAAEGGVMKQIGEEYLERGAHGCVEYHSMMARRALRGVYLRFAGGEEFASGEEAMNRTEDQCMAALAPIIVHAFADGVQIGQNTSKVVKKYKFFKKINNIFDEEGFRADSGMFSLEVSSDYEAMEKLEWYLRNSAAFLAVASGYTVINDGSDQLALSRVWDVWGLAAQSCIGGMFLTGLQAGENWAQDDVLAGIARATEEQ